MRSECPASILHRILNIIVTRRSFQSSSSFAILLFPSNLTLLSLVFLFFVMCFIPFYSVTPSESHIALNILIDSTNLLFATLGQPSAIMFGSTQCVVHCILICYGFVVPVLQYNRCPTK